MSPSGVFEYIVPRMIFFFGVSSAAEEEAAEEAAGNGAAPPSDAERFFFDLPPRLAHVSGPGTRACRHCFHEVKCCAAGRDELYACAQIRAYEVRLGWAMHVAGGQGIVGIGGVSLCWDRATCGHAEPCAWASW